MTRPHFVFILLDDFGWVDTGCYGSSFYLTPHIDALCAQSMRFTDAYAACPVCSPTRASILTGKYPATVGITDWIDSRGAFHPARGRLVDVPYLKALPRSEQTVAQALREGGYQTWHVGKWHLGGEGHLPQDHGFEINIGGCEQGSPGRGGYFSPWTIPALADADVPEGTYLPDYLTDQAIRLIRERDERPFFLYLPYYAVHTPIQAKEEDIQRFRDRARTLGLDRVDPFVEGEFFPCEHKKDQRVRRRILQSDPVYAAMIADVDRNIGRLLRVLEEEGLAQDTVVFFTSDNGGLATSEGSPTCNAPLCEGKGWMYEGGTREPLLIRWPGRIPAGSVCHEPVTSPDFYPTLLEMAGLPARPEQHCDGTSLMPLLQGDRSWEQRAIFWHYPHYGNQGGTPGSSVRCGEYKLIEFFEDGRLELYDLSRDMGERHDLSDQQPARVRELHQLLRQWRDRVEAKIPAPNPAFQPRSEE